MATEPLNEIAPLLAVRTALGLSVDDAAAIMEQPPGVILDLDTLPSDTLGALAGMMAKKNGVVRLVIKNPDDTTFQEWIVSPTGNLVGKPASDS